MASQAYEQLAVLGGEMVDYTPYQKAARPVLALVEPIRRTDSLGSQSFLAKVWNIFIVKSSTEGIASVKENFDTLAILLSSTDDAPTTLRITKILPDRDNGLPGDGVGMWHLEGTI